MAASRPSPLALGLAPLVLRLVVGITFTWAGLGKWFNTMPVQGEDAALLANLGVLSTTPPPPPASPASPTKPLPTSRSSRPPAALGLVLAQADTTPPSTTKPVPVTAGPPLATAADFPNPVPVRTMWMIAVALHHASHPAADSSGVAPMALWPRFLGEGLWPKVFCVAVLVAELGGGIGLLIGLFTRFWSLGIACTMGVAMWLTQFGPAIQSGHARWGFLPALDPWAQEWQMLGWQFTLFGAAVALLLLGSGALACDRAIAGFRGAPPPPRPAGGARG